MEKNQDNRGNSWTAYNKPSFDCKVKEDFSIKLISLLFIRGMKFKEFCIGCKIDGAEAFGDIAFKFIENGSCKILLLHIDHPQNDSVTFDVIGSDDQLNLLSCFQCMNTIKENYKSYTTLQNLGSFDNFEFVFYTSATVLETFILKNSNSCSLSVLNTGKSVCAVHSIYDEAYKEAVKCLEEIQVYKTFLEDMMICVLPKDIRMKLQFFEDNINVKEIKERLQTLKEKPTQETVKVLCAEVRHLKCVSSHANILSKFKLYTEQTHIHQIGDLIRNEIRQMENICEFGVHIMYKYLLKEIEMWWITCSCYLNNNSDIWQHFICKLKKYSKIQKPCIETVSKGGIRFFVFSTKTIRNCIFQYRVLNVVASSNDISLSCLKVFQVLENVTPCKYLWISIDTLFDWTDDVLQMWFNDDFPILVIENRIGHDDFKNTISELAQILRMHSQKYIIVISTESNKFTSTLKNMVFPDDYCELKDTFRFIDLDDQSQLKILNNVVQFQGKAISIGSLIGSSSDLKGSLNATVVSQLLWEGNSITIGPPLSESVPSFIPRTLELLIEVDINIIKSTTDTEIFVVSGTTLPALRKILLNEDIQLYSSENHEVNVESRLFCLVGTSNGFPTLCEHFPFKNVHHFVFKNDSLWWRETKGEAKYLKDHLIQSENARYVCKIFERCRSSIYNPYNLLDSLERHMIVLGESGSGKSTLLSALEKNTKANAPLHWLIHLHFNNDIQLIIKTKKEDFDCEIIIQIMYSLLRYDHQASALEHILLRHDLEKRGNIIVICEGLDTVNPVYMEKVLEFIHALDTMKVKKLWIVSSHSMRSILEKAFKTVVTELQPLTHDEQISLLHSLWKGRCKDGDRKELEGFVMNMQRLYSSNKTSLLSLPLICVMSAEIFETQLTEYLSSNTVHWPENLDIAQVYDRFILQRRLHNVLNVSCELHEKQEEFFMNKHMLCALFSLLDIAELDQLNLLDKCKNICKLVKEVRQFGIIQTIVNKKPIFLHKTFAEYFAAMWFSKNIDKSREFLKQRIFASNFRSVLIFFDYFLIRGHELHTAVLKSDYQGIRSLLAYGVDSNLVDKGGRTALHLAIVHSQPRGSTLPMKDFENETHDCITKLLVHHSINTKMIDSVFMWRPVQYAMELKKWDAMDLLLKEQIDFNDIDHLKCRLSDELFVHEGLRIGSEKGYFNLIECFSCCNINISENVIETNEGQYSPLHIAAKYGQLKLVRYLLSKRVKIFIKDNKGISPLHLAAHEGMIEVLIYLLQRGADLHCTDRIGNIPLNFAIFKANLQIIVLLIEQYHSNINFQNKFGDSPLHHAVKVGHITIIEYLLMKGAHVDICNRDGNTALHLAVWMGSLSVVKVLLEYGANVNVCNKNGDTPLTLNAGAGNLEIVKILIESGSDINKQNDDGNAALHWAARQNKENVVDYLLQKGADKNAQNKYGNTALHRAVEHGCLATTKFLINAGCNIQLQNCAGYTAMNMRSRSKEVTDCVACL